MRRQSLSDIELSVRSYECFQQEHHTLFVRTWYELAAKGEAKALSESQLRSVYDKNPAGISHVAVAEHEGRWAGAIAAIPTKMVLLDGTRETAYQIGDFMVDLDWRGHGLGKALLSSLTGALENLKVYTFPNKRSIRIFLRNGFEEVRSLRTVVYPLRSASRTKRGRSAGDQVREVSLDEACKIADLLLRKRSARGGIEKSGEYVKWRYSLIRDSDDFTFSSVAGAEGEPVALAVWSLLRHKGVQMQVLVDHIEAAGEEVPISALAAEGRRRGAFLGVVNLEEWELSSAPPLSIRMPAMFDPRPGTLLVRAIDRDSAKLLAECSFATADWMGF